MALRWYGDEVMAKLREASDRMVTEAAFLVEAQTKINIRNNGQVDTGFMMNSVYAVSPNDDSYNQAQSEAQNAAPEKDMAPKADPPKNGAVVAVGAEYAIFQEERIPFLYPALEKVIAQMGGQVVAAGKGAL